MTERPETISICVASRCETLNEALAWVVQQIDQRGFEHPNVTIEPVFAYPPEDDLTAGGWYFDAQVSSEMRTDPEVPA